MDLAPFTSRVVGLTRIWAANHGCVPFSCRNCSCAVSDGSFFFFVVIWPVSLKYVTAVILGCCASVATPSSGCLRFLGCNCEQLSCIAFPTLRLTKVVFFGSSSSCCCSSSAATCSNHAEAESVAFFSLSLRFAVRSAPTRS